MINKRTKETPKQVDAAKQAVKREKARATRWRKTGVSAATVRWMKEEGFL
jgi:hypothetical protein